MEEQIAIHWFRRDLRLVDNTSLNKALQSGLPVLPLFIFDTTITNKFDNDDPRISFIYETLLVINKELHQFESSLLIEKDDPLEVWKRLIEDYNIKQVYFNEDYEPEAIQRDEAITALLDTNGIEVFSYKDQVIFSKNDITKNDGKPYTVFTPYKRKWLKKNNSQLPLNPTCVSPNYIKTHFTIPTLDQYGFKQSNLKVHSYSLEDIHDYEQDRNYPAKSASSKLGPHLRFGTGSIRQIVNQVKDTSATFLSELIWREFFMQVLYHFPHVAERSFKYKYDAIEWRNKEDDFEKWCTGKTGYPFVDAGMRELNETGYMHNRARMVVASFLCKHLLIDWRWGEAYFANKLLDFELSSNNGNWQWAAGAGCDAAPYFRVFNPTTQQQKFDKHFEYIKKWVPEFGTSNYPEPIVEHSFARVRAIDVYKQSLANTNNYLMK